MEGHLAKGCAHLECTRNCILIVHLDSTLKSWNEKGGGQMANFWSHPIKIFKLKKNKIVIFNSKIELDRFNVGPWTRPLLSLFKRASKVNGH